MGVPVRIAARPFSVSRGWQFSSNKRRRAWRGFCFLCTVFLCNLVLSLIEFLLVIHVCEYQIVKSSSFCQLLISDLTHISVLYFCIFIPWPKLNWFCFPLPWLLNRTVKPNSYWWLLCSRIVCKVGVRHWQSIALLM